VTFLKNSILLLVSLAIALLLAEFGTRIAFNDLTSTPNMRTWFGKRWSKEHVTRNSLRFREREIAPVAEPGVFRIALIGDSFTYGQGVPAEARYSNRLEAQLQAQGFQAEVLNFGRPGANTEDHRIILNDYVLPLQPDLVLVQWLPNDFENSDLRWAPRMTPLVVSHTLHSWLMLHSAMYFLVDIQWRNIYQAINGTGDVYSSYLLAPFAGDDPEALASTMAPIHDLLADLNAGGVPYALFLHPMLLPNMTDGYVYEPLHEAVLEACRSAGADCFDLLPLYRALDNGDNDYNYVSLWVNRFDGHPGEESNKLVADYLAKLAVGQSWLEQTAEDE